MTVNQGRRRRIIKKSIVLSIIAAILGILCFLASSHDRIPDHGNLHLIYTLASVILSVFLILYIALKLRFFHDIFAKEFTGTVLTVKREIIRSHRAMLSMDDVVLIVKLDGTEKKIKLRLPGNKVGKNVYFAGDRVHRLKGTRFPINLTREVQQHICPICGRDSCYGDECPDCGVKY